VERLFLAIFEYVEDGSCGEHEYHHDRNYSDLTIASIRGLCFRGCIKTFGSLPGLPGFSVSTLRQVLVSPVAFWLGASFYSWFYEQVQFTNEVLNGVG
jgi:hypothetical protein